MIYRGTYQQETIMVSPEDCTQSYQFIDLTKDAADNILTVRLDTGLDECEWSFYLDEPSDYERIKFNIMQSVFETENMEKLAETLDEIFNDGFEDILIEDEE